MVRRLGLALAALTLAVSCTSGGKVEDRAARTTTSPTTEEVATPEGGWVGAGPTPASRLQASGGHIVYLGVNDDDHLELVGLDPATGKVAWRRASTHGVRISGVELVLMVDATTAFHFEPSDNVAAAAFGRGSSSGVDIVAVDTATGQVRWHQPLDAPPMPPADDCGGAVCTYVDPGDETLTRVRFDRATGAILGVGSHDLEPILGNQGDAAVSAARSDSLILGTSGYGATEVWRHTRAEVFGDETLTPDYGWSGFGAPDGTWVLWLGTEADSVGAVAGVGATGAPLWRRADTLPCFFLTGDVLAQRNPPVLCAGRFDAGAGTLDLTSIEGVDPVSGTARWTVASPGFDGFEPGSSVARLADGTFVLDLPERRLKLDLSSGPVDLESTPPDLWCEAPSDGQSIDDPVVGPDEYVTPTTYEPCQLGTGPDGHTPGSVPQFAGAQVGGFGAWISDGRVVAAPM
ncbi:MAG: hypothetical protein QOH68_4038 [Nocardioidaceae bacterium]|nr:hypothetical protein [Nocardioidaceae bacterium]